MIIYSEMAGWEIFLPLLQNTSRTLEYYMFVFICDFMLVGTKYQAIVVLIFSN